MDWKRGNQLSSYLRSSLWIVPIGAVILEQIFSLPVRMLDARLGWSWLGLGVEGARALCNAVVTLTLTFTVFTFGSLLIAIQVASGQYTPRIIATTLLCNNVVRYTVGLFVFSFVFAIQAVNRVENAVPQLLVFLTGLLGFACLAAFLFLIDYAARLLRPVSLVQNVGEAGLKVIDSVYPENIGRPGNRSLPEIKLTSPTRTILHQGSSAIVLAVNVPKLLTEAIRAKGVVELAPQVGDFVGVGEPLFLLHGGAASIPDQTLEGCIIFGSERTLEQDPLFAFRILVDIASKALSPAINDPTTAVLAIDQLHRLLRRAGRRNLRTDFSFDASGELRLVVRTPDWGDFVDLAFTEIRFYGAANIQIPRRVRAMLLNLANTLPPERHPALRQQLDLLDRMLEKFYVLPEDLALARAPDTQGLGGSTDGIAASWKA
jgi:uncharacterized membrane protein